MTQILCRALIIKKEVAADRFGGAPDEETCIECPRDCHACCALDVVLDLTAVESLMIYLLNKEVVEIIDAYTDLHDPTGYCPFFIMDKCIIHTYKPSACQMYMPFNYLGKAVCLYHKEQHSVDNYAGSKMCSLHSNSYAVHGFMMLSQREVSLSFSQQFFCNIYDGTHWWKNHYSQLPLDTRRALESILTESEEGKRRMENTAFEELLAQGLDIYNQSIDEYEVMSNARRS